MIKRTLLTLAGSLCLTTVVSIPLLANNDNDCSQQFENTQCANADSLQNAQACQKAALDKVFSCHLAMQDTDSVDGLNVASAPSSPRSTLSSAASSATTTPSPNAAPVMPLNNPPDNGTKKHIFNWF